MKMAPRRGNGEENTIQKKPLRLQANRQSHIKRSGHPHDARDNWKKHKDGPKRARLTLSKLGRGLVSGNAKDGM